MTEPGYPIPAQRWRIRQVVRRSQFIATLHSASTADEAQALIGTVRGEFPDASHHCWAYRLGPASSSAHIGMSDDGEPKGTAGRPMLNILLHSDLGDVVVVVSRYFGGTKLGTGGLVRAYSAAVQAVLATAPLERRVPSREQQLAVDYPSLEPLTRLVAEHGGQIIDSVYTSAVAVRVSIPEATLQPFNNALAGMAGVEPKDFS